MKRLVICVLAVCGIVGLLVVDSTSTRAGDDEAKKKLEQIRKELDELTKKEKDLAKQRDEVIQKEKALQKQRDELQRAIAQVQNEAIRRAEDLRLEKEMAKKKFEEADKKMHYAKIELRGKLVHPKNPQLPRVLNMMFVLTNETFWPLQFGDDKAELLKTATKLVDEPVIVTGAISTQKRKQPFIYPTIPLEISPRPIRDLRILPESPYGFPNYDMPLPVVVVESIRLFEGK